MEVISSDSRQIFRKMDIGTDKISKEIRDKIPHHQIDIVDPDQTYTAGEWKDDVDKEVDDITFGRCCWTCFTIIEMSCNRDAESDRIVLGEGISFVDRESL